MDRASIGATVIGIALAAAGLFALQVWHATPAPRLDRMVTSDVLIRVRDYLDRPVGTSKTQYVSLLRASAAHGQDTAGVVALLTDELGSPDPDRRWAAAMFLGALPSPLASERLLRFAKSAEAIKDLRVIVRALGQDRSPDILTHPAAEDAFRGFDHPRQFPLFRPARIVEAEVRHFLCELLMDEHLDNSTLDYLTLTLCHSTEYPEVIASAVIAFTRHRRNTVSDCIALGWIGNVLIDPLRQSDAPFLHRVIEQVLVNEVISNAHEQCQFELAQKLKSTHPNHRRHIAKLLSGVRDQKLQWIIEPLLKH